MQRDCCGRAGGWAKEAEVPSVGLIELCQRSYFPIHPAHASSAASSPIEHGVLMGDSIGHGLVPVG